MLGRALLMVLMVFACVLPASAKSEAKPPEFVVTPLTAPPVSGGFLGATGGSVFQINGRAIRHLDTSRSSWSDVATSLPDDAVVVTSAGNGVVIGTMSNSFHRLFVKGGVTALEDLPTPPPLRDRTLAAIGSTICLIGVNVDDGRPRMLEINLAKPAKQQRWIERPAPPLAVHAARSLGLGEWIYRFGLDEAGKPVGVKWNLRLGWREVDGLPQWNESVALAGYGQAHLLSFVPGETLVRAYHTITGKWLELMPLANAVGSEPRAAVDGGAVLLLDDSSLRKIEIKSGKTKYGWIDHSVVVIYLVGMIAVGWYFIGKEKSSGDFFRGGSRIPWWASGMSLFATGASAISLMAMPGMSYANDWSYLPQVSFLPLLFLPISMFFMAPLVRRLNISTSNEYLERRFGLVARMIGSAIFMFTQVAGRMASVMLLPAIALSAITDTPIWVCVVVMGIVTTAYTFLGGLSAVVWTDTIQGFVMAFSIFFCLLLAIWKLGMGAGEIWDTTAAAGKLHALDLDWSLAYPTLWVFVITTFLGSLGGISDQNYVQRVQCTPKLRDAQKAVAMQLGVAVPLNLLLFSLGTVLWLFYRQRPEALDPTMKTDGIFPFFVAQNLPTGLSGLVVAALLAATMSTISSSICAVSDLGVNDFYRRFNKRATDRSALWLGRLLTGLVGVFGTAAAIALNELPIRSVWDIAILVTNLISNGILGLFMLGLFTRRATEAGAIVGVLCGMGVVFYLQRFHASDVTFWLYGFIGSGVTFSVGYVVSLLLPHKPRDLTGLTVHTFKPKSEPAA